MRLVTVGEKRRREMAWGATALLRPHSSSVDREISALIASYEPN